MRSPKARKYSTIPAAPSASPQLQNLPGDVLWCVAEHLGAAEKIRLGACSKTLRAASAAWFRDTPIRVDGTTCNPSTAWLRKVDAPVHVRMSEWGCVDGKVSAANVLRRLRAVKVVDVDIHGRVRQVPAALASLTATTALQLGLVRSGMEHVAALRQLQSLTVSLAEVHPGLTALTSLSRLAVTGGFGAHLETNLSRLARLPRLQHLQIGPCVLSTVAGFSRLTALTHLDVRGNIIEQRGWEDVARLPRLRVLNAATCHLVAVPLAWSRLSGITSLDLTGNYAIEEWEPLRHLTGLRRLATWAREGEVPRAFGELTALTYLSIYNAKRGWSHLDQLVRLKKLVIFTSRMEGVRLPAVLSRLTALTALVATYNYVESGWHHLQHLPSLCVLNASHCHLTTLAPWLPTMTALTSLDLSGCQLGDDPDSTINEWNQLRLPPRLARLHLGWCGLDAVPSLLESPELAAHLTALDLSTNGFSSESAAWHRLAGLTGLQELHLHQSSMRSVPAVLSQLTGLTRLSLDRNPLWGGWHHLRSLRRLKRLDIGQHTLPAELEGMRAIMYPPCIAHRRPADSHAAYQ